MIWHNKYHDTSLRPSMLVYLLREQILVRERMHTKRTHSRKEHMHTTQQLHHDATTNSLRQLLWTRCEHAHRLQACLASWRDSRMCSCTRMSSLRMPSLSIMVKCGVHVFSYWNVFSRYACVLLLECVLLLASHARLRTFFSGKLELRARRWGKCCEHADSHKYLDS